jgi:hypothetical protein
MVIMVIISFMEISMNINKFSWLDSDSGFFFLTRKSLTLNNKETFNAHIKILNTAKDLGLVHVIAIN